MHDLVSFAVGFFFCVFITWLWKKLWRDKDGWG
jgi:hypothetical protein